MEHKPLTADEKFMVEALKEAAKAKDKDEVPVGAVIISEKQIIGRGYNQVELLNDVTAHAEILAITAASEFLGSKYLNDCTLFVTLEPCPMCAGAIKWAQLRNLVYAATDEKGGFMLIGKQLLHPKTKVKTGILEEPAAEILQDFFKEKRN